MTFQYAPLQTDPSPAQAPLLPVWAIVGNAYRATWYYRWEYLKIIWCWLLLAIPVMCIYSWFAWPFMSAAICLDFAHLPDKASMNAVSSKMFIASLPATLFTLFSGASIAVAWHRLILRQEKITSTRYLRCDGVVRDYFIFGFCILLLTSLANIISLASNDYNNAPVIGFGVGLLMIAGGILAIRLSIILPARALELKHVTLKAVLQNTSWNFWRIFWGGLLCVLPGIPLSGIPLYFIIKTGCGSTIAGPIMYSAGMLLSTLIVLPLELAFLSLSYQHFFEREKQSIQQTSNFPFKTVVSALFILMICALFHTVHNAVKSVSVKVNTLKDLTQCSDIAQGDASIQACTTLMNMMASNQGAEADLSQQRGMTKLYAISPAAAIDDLANAVRQNPTDAYKVIWLHLARVHAGQNDQPEFDRNSALVPDDKWPAPVIALYQGKGTIEQVYEKAKIGDATEQRGQTCEANFYGGELYLQKNMKDDAVKFFQAAKNDCPAEFIEKGAARAELTALDRNIQQPAPKP